ncbi:MAG: hypothetical protein MUE33_11235 [Cytophagaceae bacterium]|nr:hypothetical protein [Cytophagaceae bacterium]
MLKPAQKTFIGYLALLLGYFIITYVIKVKGEHLMILLLLIAVILYVLVRLIIRHSDNEAME